MPLEQCDRREEAGTLQTVAVQTARRTVGRADQYHALLQERVEESCQDHRVGDVADVELVQAEHLRISPHPGRDANQRVRLVAKLVQACVHFLHEAMEMLAADGHAGVRAKEIHQPGLAAAHAAPEVDPASLDGDVRRPPQARQTGPP